MTPRKRDCVVRMGTAEQHSGQRAACLSRRVTRHGTTRQRGSSAPSHTVRMTYVEACPQRRKRRQYAALRTEHLTFRSGDLLTPAASFSKSLTPSLKGDTYRGADKRLVALIGTHALSGTVRQRPSRVHWATCKMSPAAWIPQDPWASKDS
jgi:hypothetical protein